MLVSPIRVDCHPLFPARSQHAVQQDLPGEEDPGEEGEAEPANPAVVPHAHGQHDPLQREASPLAPDEDRLVNGLIPRPKCNLSRDGAQDGAVV